MAHTSAQQPEALRLADKYEIEGFSQDHHFAQEQADTPQYDRALVAQGKPPAESGSA